MAAKYVITGKDVKKGNVGNDAPDLNEYFELGWEVMTTHLLAKRMLQTGDISADDTLVTASGREFLYSKTV